MAKIVCTSLLFVFLCVQTTHSQEDTVIGTCSSTVMVLTKEIKREIRDQVTKALEDGGIQNCSFIETTMNIESLEEISHKLDFITKKMTSLYPGMTPSHPATSCMEIFDFIGNTSSGYYWLQSTNGSAVRVYCDMTLACKGVGGGWMQVAKLDMTNSSHQCPPGTRLRTGLPKRLCGINFDGPGCSSTTFDVHGVRYRQVCGKIIAYQDASPDAFRLTNTHSIDNNYVDGISLTHGINPRKHIWTFVAALDEVGTHPFHNCPCTNISQAASASQPPSFVGSDYFCDTGSEQQWSFTFYPDNPLWDGAGCGPANTCCSLNNPPWFLKQLPFTTADDIEMRMCRDHPLSSGRIDEDTPIEMLEFYIQ